MAQVSHCPYMGSLALNHWSPQGGCSSPGSAQENCEGISWCSQLLGGQRGSQYWGPGTLGNLALLKTAPHLRTTLMSCQTLSTGQNPLTMSWAYDRIVSHVNMEAFLAQY